MKAKNTTAALVVFSLLGVPLAAAGPAVAAADAEPGPEVRSPAACPLLFGDPAARERNRRQRAHRLDAVEPGEHAINLIYSGSWRKPTPIRFKGLKLVSTAGAGLQQPSALVEVGELPAAVDCRPGIYELHTDDSLGGSSRVLAILEDVLLLEVDGQLRYLAPQRFDATATKPAFRMIWRSTWTLAGVAGGGGTASATPSARPKPTRHTSHRTSRKLPSRR
jgi:hypothetical protein